MLPLAKPTITALSVIHAIGVWNDYVTPSIYLKNYPTLAVGLRHSPQPCLREVLMQKCLPQ